MLAVRAVNDNDVSVVSDVLTLDLPSIPTGLTSALENPASPSGIIDIVAGSMGTPSTGVVITEEYVEVNGIRLPRRQNPD